MVKRLWAGFIGLFNEPDDEQEPFYDPVQLGAVAIGCLVAIGSLYWLLWTLLVFEGGIGSKLRAGLAVLFTSRTLKDYGCEAAPYAMGAFEGWAGNTAALALCVLLVAGLHRLYRQAAGRSHQGG